MKIICRDRQKTSAPQGRALSSVAADINRLLSPKSYEQLQTLEVQVKKKLNSNEPIDTDYWEELLRSLTVWKARARLRNVYQDVINERVRDLRNQQKAEAEAIRQKLAPLAPTVPVDDLSQVFSDSTEFKGLDPDPLLHVRQEDKGLEIMDESAFLRQVVSIWTIFLISLRMSHMFCRPKNVKKYCVWDLFLCGSEALRELPSSRLARRLRAWQHRECLVASPPFPMMISRRPPRPSTRGNWPRVSVKMKRSSLAKKP